ncbi:MULTISPECIES: penicillin-binding protein 1B [Zhongshania]|jgi:penicillin-binding protein 1B|uniref:Penicillin-binding protein 1B n=1 Tax=Zhongshania antarctica TaxID=641702 RepID=A0A840R747_9GAMM|nr:MULTISPECIES: penicillin-binding protein 1B [Zhongshania]MBB5188697.1 penicillin-binding protein 1B [Zhongshania antarctica]
MVKKASKASGASAAKFSWWGLFVKLSLAFAVVMLIFFAYCDAKVRGTFDRQRYEQPAKVYARPLVLATGAILTAYELESELGELGYSNRRLVDQPGSYSRQGDHFTIYLRPFSFADGAQPARKIEVEMSATTVRVVRNKLGDRIAEEQLDPMVIGGVYPGRHEDRIMLSLAEAPQMLLETLVQVEDQHFYSHFGISPRSIARAMLANIKAGRTVQGGSTLTQQLVKNTILSNERSLWRKAKEAVMSILTEMHYSKDRILEAYINEVYLGQEGNRAIHGFGLAARHYYNRPLEELNLGQVAMLVGLVKGPSYYDPWRHPERAKTRRNIVLGELEEEGWLTTQQLAAWQKEPLELAKTSALAGVYPAYVDLVRRQLSRDYQSKELQTSGLRIFTPFDPVLQRRAEKATVKSLQRLEARQKDLEVAMVVTKVNSGDVVAVIGGKRPKYAGFNRALDALRPIGSLAKPAVYLAALNQPNQYSLLTKVSDEPVSISNANGSQWRPSNYDRKSHGEVPLHTALAHSYNIATARLGMQVGLDKVMAMFQRLGVQRPLLEVPSMLLGSAELAPIEVAAMYQTLAADGRYTPLRTIYAITDNKGELLARYPQKPKQVVSSAAVHLLQYAMLETVREGTGKGVYQVLPKDYRVAGKTGTSNDTRDSWFAGFAGDYMAVVWMGLDNNTSTGLTGASGALMVWRQFMAEASTEQMPFSMVDGVEYQWVDGISGKLSQSWCENARYMPFMSGSAPSERGGCAPEPEKVWGWFRSVFD